MYEYKQSNTFDLGVENEVKESIGLQRNKELETEWQTYSEQIKELVDKLNAKVTELDAGDDKASTYWEVDRRIMNFGNIIRRKYPTEFEKYIALHALGGSSLISYAKAPKLDFPEPDSVKSFLEKIMTELANKNGGVEAEFFTNKTTV